MTQQLGWGADLGRGHPLRMEFAPDSRRLAVAAVTSRAGQMVTNLYLLPLNQGTPAAGLPAGPDTVDGLAEWRCPVRGIQP